MYTLFQYNWQVRDDWFKWCEQLSKEELLRKRIGGIGSILETLFHIVDVEHSWINALQEKEDCAPQFKEYQSIQKVKALSDLYKRELEDFLQVWSAIYMSKGVKSSACFSKFNWERTINLENGLHCKCKPFFIYKKIS